MTPMRAAESWTDNKSLAVWVRAIQADARRSAIEECAAECKTVSLYCGRFYEDGEVHEFGTGVTRCVEALGRLLTP